MRKIIFIFLIFCTNTLLGQAPDKNYKFKITSKYSGDEVLSIGSELEITTYQTINWSAPTYSGNWPFSGNITGFSKSGNDITVNFNLSNNPYGHSGTMRINLDQKFFQFFEPNIDYSAKQNRGTYYFEEILDFGDNIIVTGEFECSSFKIMNKITPIYSSLLFKNHSLEYEDARGNQRIEFVDVKSNNQKSTGSVMRNNIKFGTFALTENKLTILAQGISLIYDFKLSKEKEERLRKEELQRIKLENQKTDADKLTIDNINNMLVQNMIDEAAKEYSNLNSRNLKLKEMIQNKLNEKYKDSVINLSSKQIEAYIQNYIDSEKRAEDEAKREKIRTGQNRQLAMSSLGVLEPGEYNVIFDKLGSPSIKDFPQLTNQSVKNIGEFKIYFKLAASFRIEKKDSVVTGCIYEKFVRNSWGEIDNTQIFIDTNENFYFKTKKGLPLANFKKNEYDNGVPINMVRITKYYTKNKYANGILIHSYPYYTQKDVKIKKKDY
jgi:hypothetical protein